MDKPDRTPEEILKEVRPFTIDIRNATLPEEYAEAKIKLVEYIQNREKESFNAGLRKAAEEAKLNEMDLYTDKSAQSDEYNDNGCTLITVDKNSILKHLKQ